MNSPYPMPKSPILVMFIATFAAACGQTPDKSESAKPVACTMEAKICPDGSAVGREGPNCEFAKCPGEEWSAP